MKSTTKTTSKRTVKKSVATKAHAVKTISAKRPLSSYISPTSEDFKNAMLVFSLLVNIFFLTAWITIAVSRDYAYVLAQSLVN